MVRDVFRLARENAPAIIFIDEIDAIATKRFDAQTGADHEVQRILLELLNQMDGFDQTTNIKVYHSNSPAFKKIQLIGQGRSQKFLTGGISIILMHFQGQFFNFFLITGGGISRFPPTVYGPVIGICVQRSDDWHYAANGRLIMQ